jgi:hypothetical protein
MIDARRNGLTYAILGVGVALLLLQWGLLVFAGPPVTHDGFWHLGWVEALNHAVHEEGVYPRWYAEAFGGAGSPSFIYYPPMFRLLSLPFGLFSDAASVPLRGAVALVLLFHAAAAWASLRAWIASPRSRALLWVAVLLNPYFLVNVWVRGAWPEALAMAWLWLLALALWWLMHGGLRRGTALAAVAFAGVFLSHHPSALLWLYAASPIALALLAWRQFRVLGALGVALVAGLALASFHLVPAILDQSAIRLATGEGILEHQWPQRHADGSHIARALASVWAWLLLVMSFGILMAIRARTRWLSLHLGVLGLALVAMTPLAEPLYAGLPQLGRIQFPWRWLCVATPAALCVLGTAANAASRWRIAALLLGVAGAASGGPALRALAFMPQESRVLDAIYRCERTGPDCSRFDAAPPLRQHFGELRFLAQHPSHYGPWIDRAGRIWRSEIYDYLPRGFFVETWARAPNGMFMPPFMPRPDWIFAPADAVHVLGERRGTQRRVIDLEVREPVTVTLERLRFPGWELRMRLADGSHASITPDPESHYYRFALRPGLHRIQLRQVGTRAERIGEGVSLVAWLALLLAAWRARPRESALRRAAPRPGATDR